MSAATVTTLVDRLAELLENLTARQAALHAVIRGKLEAMRRADVEAMIAATHREGELTSEVTALDGQRRELAAKLSEALSRSASERGRRMSLRSLAARLDAVQRARILKLADTLRRRMLDVAEANRVVELVSREMLTFFKDVFSAMVRDDESPLTYSAGGELGAAFGARVLDAVG